MFNQKFDFMNNLENEKNVFDIFDKEGINFLYR